jgi:hypothetical protein
VEDIPIPVKFGRQGRIFKAIFFFPFADKERCLDREKGVQTRRLEGGPAFLVMDALEGSAPFVS